MSNLTTKKGVHQWDRDGERCVKCGDKDWMQDPVCRGRQHTESSDCWCAPTLDYVAENGSQVWMHHEPN